MPCTAFPGRTDAHTFKWLRTTIASHNSYNSAGKGHGAGSGQGDRDGSKELIAGAEIGLWRSEQSKGRPKSTGTQVMVMVVMEMERQEIDRGGGGSGGNGTASSGCASGGDSLPGQTCADEEINNKDAKDRRRLIPGDWTGGDGTKVVKLFLGLGLLLVGVGLVKLVCL